MALRKHVLVIPFPAYGHYIPMLEFSKKLVLHHEVTMLVSKNFLEELATRDLLPPDSIRVERCDDQLTQGIDEITSLKHFIDLIHSVGPHYADFVKTMAISPFPSSRTFTSSILPAVHFVVADCTFVHPFEVCNNRGIPVYCFSPLPAQLVSHSLRITKDTPILPDKDFMNNSNPDQAKLLAVPESLKILRLEANKAVYLSQGLILNSFKSLEPQALQVLADTPAAKDLPVYFVGPLVPEAKITANGEIAEKVKAWLDAQKDRSVVYFSFGTVATTTPSQVVQINRALVKLGRPFIWSLRPQHATETVRNSITTDITINLPYLILPWVPQKTILGHSGTAAFVTHCGWNSVLEAVTYGVPMVAWPFFGDQPINAQLIAQHGNGKVIEKTGMQGSREVPEDEIIAVMEEVAGGNATYAEKARELKIQSDAALQPNGTSGTDFVRLLETM